MLSLDLPSVPPARRMPLLLAACGALHIGDTLEFVDDRDPAPRYFALDRLQPDRFVWRYLQCGPSRWRVHITRRDAAVT